VDLRWKAIRTPTADYDVFVHVLDASNGIVFQLDHPLKAPSGKLPTSWSPGDLVTESFLTVPPPGPVPGIYNLRIGLYVAKPMRVLPVVLATLPQPADSWKDHAILIDRVDCK
jgi:hypothetical protein